MKTATVWIDPDTRMIALRTPYDHFLVASIKTVIPGASRRWDGARKIWLIDQGFMAELEKLLATLDYRVEDGTLPHETTAASGSDSPYHALLEGLPSNVLKQIYRVIALACHPDQGGDPELMKKVNLAWGRIERRQGK